jgi:transcription elongation factor SPT5
VSLKTIDAKGIEPSLDELQKFQKPGEDGLEAMGLPPAAAKTRGQFMKGDTVVVVEGDLRNLMGIVEKVDDDSVFIRPKNKDLKGTLTFKDRQLCKFFKTGDHVKVIAGKHEGATGMIVKIQNNVITLLSDTTREDVRHLSKTCCSCQSEYYFYNCHQQVKSAPAPECPKQASQF